MTTYEVVGYNTFNMDDINRWVEATTGDKGFTKWLKEFLSQKEESPFIYYEVQVVE